MENVNKKQTLNIKNLRKSGDVIFHKKIAKLLILLLQENKWSLSKIRKETGLSFPYVTKVIKEFENAGIVLTSKDKKTRNIILTEKGISIAAKINELFTLIYENEGEKNKKEENENIKLL